jgi:hypothetical protein
MTLQPRIGRGGWPLPSMDLTTPYILWMVTMASTLLASLGLAANLWIYVFNGIGAVYDWPVVYPEMNHAKWLFASGLFSTLGFASFLLKLMVDTQSRSITTVRFPTPIIARTTGADPVLDKFQCWARVEIDAYSDELAKAISTGITEVTNLLENGLKIAISDQVTQFSKAKIEDTLKLSLGERFDLLAISGVTLLDLRQERVHDLPETECDTEDAPEVENASSAMTEAVEVATETKVEDESERTPSELAS